MPTSSPHDLNESALNLAKAKQKYAEYTKTPLENDKAYLVFIQELDSFLKQNKTKNLTEWLDAKNHLLRHSNNVLNQKKNNTNEALKTYQLAKLTVLRRFYDFFINIANFFGAGLKTYQHIAIECQNTFAKTKNAYQKELAFIELLGVQADFSYYQSEVASSLEYIELATTSTTADDALELIINPISAATAKDVIDKKSRYIDKSHLRQYKNLNPQAPVRDIPIDILYGDEDFFIPKDRREVRAPAIIKLGNLLVKYEPGGKGSFVADVYYIDYTSKQIRGLFSSHNARYSGASLEDFLPFNANDPDSTCAGLSNDPSSVMIRALARMIKPFLMKLAFRENIDLKAFQEVNSLYLAFQAKDRRLAHANKTDLSTLAAEIARSYYIHLGVNTLELINLVNVYIEKQHAMPVTEPWINSLLNTFVDNDRYPLKLLLLDEDIKTLKCHYLPNQAQSSMINEAKPTITEASALPEKIDAYFRIWEAIYPYQDQSHLQVIYNLSIQLQQVKLWKNKVRIREIIHELLNKALIDLNENFTVKNKLEEVKNQLERLSGIESEKDCLPENDSFYEAQTDAFDLQFELQEPIFSLRHTRLHHSQHCQVVDSLEKEIKPLLLSLDMGWMIHEPLAWLKKVTKINVFICDILNENAKQPSEILPILKRMQLFLDKIITCIIISEENLYETFPYLKGRTSFFDLAVHDIASFKNCLPFFYKIPDPRRLLNPKDSTGTNILDWARQNQPEVLQLIMQHPFLSKEKNKISTFKGTLFEERDEAQRCKGDITNPRL